MTEFLQVEKDCGIRTGEGCFSGEDIKKVLSNDKATGSFDQTPYYKVILSDGTALSFEFKSNWEDITSAYGITFDVDGPKKGKNKIGVDIFKVFIDASKNRVTILKSDLDNAKVCRENNYTTNCTNWVLLHENLDYLYCDGLNDSKTSCN